MAGLCTNHVVVDVVVFVVAVSHGQRMSSSKDHVRQGKDKSTAVANDGLKSRPTHACKLKRCKNYFCKFNVR